MFIRKHIYIAAISVFITTLSTFAFGDSVPHKGGIFYAVASGSGGTIDPQVNYEQQYWQLFASIYDGLTAFKKVSGKDGATIVPDLAVAMPKVSDKGKTLTFTLRKGIRFSNGQPVTVADVKASFERIFKVLSPTAGSFYSGIIGADACLKKPASCTLDKGIVINPKTNTVTFHLKAPDSDFYDKLALPHASILPANAPSKDAGNTPIPGTGPYMITDYDPNKGLKLVRNPYFKVWSQNAQPNGYIDELNYKFGMGDEAQVTAVENGQANWMYADVPADRLAEVATRYPSQVHLNSMAAFYYVALNVNIPPFNNLKARQAFNYAVDRNAAVKIWGGSRVAQPSCQVLPKGFPRHEGYCPYAMGKHFKPNLVKARELMKESGIRPGTPVTVITEDKTNWKNLGAYIQNVLNQLGFKAKLKALSHSIEYTYINNSKNKAQVSLTDWY